MKKTLTTYATIIILSLIMLMSICLPSLPTAHAVGTARANEDIPLVKIDGVPKRYYSAAEGVPLIIQCSPSTVELKYTFEVEYKEEVVKGTLPLTYNKESKKMEAKHTLFENGLLNYTAKIKKDEDNFTEESAMEWVVGNIDYLAPQSKESKESFYYEDNILHYTMFVDDDISAQKFTAASGLAAIMIIYIETGADIDKIKPEDGKWTIEYLESLVGKGVGVAYKQTYKPEAATAQDQLFEFVAKEDGVYFLFTLDKVANAGLEVIFEIGASSAGALPINVGGSKIDCRPIIETANRQAAEGEGKYKPEILEQLSSCSDKLRFAFDKKLSEEEKIAAYRALSAAQKAYVNAELTVRNLKIINSDLFSGTITTSVKASDIEMLKGEIIVPEIIMAVYTELEVFNEKVLNAANVAGTTKVVKLSYSLKKDGILVVPKNAVGFHIALPTSYKNVALVYGTPTKGYHLADVTMGTGWLEFSSIFSSMDYYMVVSETNSPTNLLWLWITLGVVGGMAIVGAGVFFGVIKPKMKKNNPAASKVGSDTDAITDGAKDSKITAQKQASENAECRAKNTDVANKIPTSLNIKNDGNTKHSNTPQNTNKKSGGNKSKK